MRQRRQNRLPLDVELLEPRCVPAVFTVTNLNNSGSGSLRAAIQQANDNAGADQVQFVGGLTGTLTLTSGEILIDDPLTLTGPGPGLLTLTSNDTSRIFKMDDGSASSSMRVLLFGLTLDHAYSGASEQGGAIYVNNETLSVVNCRLTNNTADWDGGAIAVDVNGTLTLQDSTVSGNKTVGTGRSGGGVYIGGDGNLLIQSSTISGNSADLRGGGVYLFSGGNLTVNASTIKDNTITGTGSGGGLYFYGSGTVNITNSTISGNTSKSGGGGLMLRELTGSATIANSTFSGNRANDNGGGIRYRSGSGALAIRNSTITGNISDDESNGFGSGGGISIDPSVTGSAQVISTIVANNVDRTGAAPDVSGAVVASFSLIRSSAGSTLTGSTLTNISGDPLLGPLANNGGPTATHKLLPGSPAIDAGFNAAGTDWDQRGAFFDRSLGVTADIGAYESDTAALVSNPIIVTNLDDSGPGSLRAAVLTANVDPQLDEIQFAAGLTGTLTLTSGSLFVIHPLLVTGPGASVLTITTNLTARAFNVDDNSGATFFTATFTGLTFDRCRVNDGTGLFIGVRGGALRADDETIIARDCVFTNNQAFQDGGALAVFGPGTIIVENCTIANNQALGQNGTGGGGGIAINGTGNLLVRNSVITGNTAEEKGGGLYSRSGGSMTVVNTTISGNAANATSVAAGGGGVQFEGTGAVLIANSTISANTTTFSGGGVAVSQFTGSATIENCTIVNNSADGSGGGVRYTGSSTTPSTGALTIRNSTITGNIADADNTGASGGGGGGVSRSSTNATGTIQLISTIVASNTDNTNAAPDVLGNVIAAFSLVRNTTGASIGTLPTNIPPGISPVLGNLQNNGGPTLTRALQSTSPCIDAGFNSSGQLTDQRGSIYYRTVNSVTDIGAYELVVAGNAPTADIVDVIPDPRNTNAGTVTVQFDRPVLGVDRSDFSLTRDGNSVSLASVPFTRVAYDLYTLNLSSVTALEGNYTLTLLANGSIRDAASNTLTASVSDTWRMDTTLPMVGIAIIAPDPRNTAVGVVTVNFSEAVTGVDINDFALTRDGAPVPLDGLTVTQVTPQQYTLNLSTVTGVAGAFNYVLTLTAGSSGIQDLAGNPLAGGTSDDWAFENVLPTADIVDIMPDPRTTAVGVVTVNFSEPVTGVSIGDFTLTRNGAGVSLAGLSLTQVTPQQYTLNLSTVTGTLGEFHYVLTLVAAGSGIQDQVGNALIADALDVWFTDNFPPTADIVDVSPDPRNAEVGVVTVNFSEPVTGVDINDFALTQNGSPVPLNGLSVSPISPQQYTLDLSTLTSLAGSYTLTLVAANSNIVDALNNSLGTNASDSWVIDLTSPMVDIADVMPDPRNATVGVVTVNFNESVTGVNITDFTLTRNGSPVPLDSLTVTQVTPQQYTLNLTSVTGTAGVFGYVLTLTATNSGIQDLAGNLLNAGASDDWTFDSVAPTADIVDITPDPRTTAVGVVTVNFSGSVTGVSIGDFTLTRNGVGTPLGSLSVTQVTPQQYTLDLTTVTGSPGNFIYVLSLAAAGSGIQDAAGNALTANASDAWQMDTVGPIADIVDVSPDPRRLAVGVVTVNFNEPVTGVDVNDFILTRDGNVVSLAGLTVFQVTPQQYTLDLLAVTLLEGSYTLTLAAANSSIVDALNNPMTADAVDAWVMDLTAPSVDIVDIAPDPRNTAVGVVTVNFSEPVTGVNITDLMLTRNGVVVPLTGLTVSQVTPQQYTLDLSSVSGALGHFNYALTLVAAGSGIQDQAGNAMSADASDAWFTDSLLPTADIVDVNPDPRRLAVSVVTVNFSEPVTGVDINDFTLRREGNVVPLAGLTVTPVTPQQYTLDLGGVTTLEGSYTLTLTAANSSIVDALNNPMTADAVDAWVMDLTAPSVDIVDIAPDPRNTAVGVVTVNFSEPVTGVDVNDFTLTRDGNAVPLTGLTVTPVTQQQYTLNLTSVTGVVGVFNYALTLTTSGSGIQDLVGNPMSVGATDGWVFDGIAPTADVVDITPDPRRTAVGVVTVNFSEPVTGVDVNDFTLTRDGGTVSLAGRTVTQVTPQQYTLDLTEVTGSPGDFDYVLTVTALGSAIRDAAGNGLAANVTGTWRMDTVAPAPSIVGISPDPRRVPVGLVTVNFNEPVTGMDANDFALTRDGNAVPLAGLSVTPVTQEQYTLDLSAFTTLEGSYTLTLVSGGSTIQDLAGNLLVADSNDTWVMDLTPPSVDIVDIAPDPRTTAVGLVTINFNEPVTGVTLGDLMLTRDGVTVPLTGLNPVMITPQRYTLNLNSVTGDFGSYGLTLRAAGSGIQDLAGNPLSADAADSWTTTPTIDTGGSTSTPGGSAADALAFLKVERQLKTKKQKQDRRRATLIVTNLGTSTVDAIRVVLIGLNKKIKLRGASAQPSILVGSLAAGQSTVVSLAFGNGQNLPLRFSSAVRVG